jgi:hypothetical protein
MIASGHRDRIFEGMLHRDMNFSGHGCEAHQPTSYFS